jgi:serine protease inhibitor
MNVIITKSFLEKFKKDFRKNHFLISELVKELKKEKLITLKIPYFKVKFKLNKLSVR